MALSFNGVVAPDVVMAPDCVVAAFVVAVVV
jgi:hypothetical protein